MKKEKSNGQREIKASYEPGKMIFEVGDQKFYIIDEVANFLFGRNVQLQFEKLHGQGETSELRSLETYVRVQRLLRKGMGMDSIAKALGCTQEKLRAFYGAERSRPHTESWGVNEQQAEHQRQSAAEMDFVKEVRRERALNETEAPEPGERFVDLLRLRNLRRQGMSDDGMADHLGLDRKEFSKFLEKNQRYLNLLP